ncbi:MAG: DUF4412 domain-containing protein [Flavobacteriales bacterium]
MNVKTLLIAAGFLISALFNVNAQEFEGRIVYSITYPKLDNPDMAAMLPKESTMFIKGDMVRVEANSGMGIKNVTITNVKDKKSTVLMDMLGQKIALTAENDEEEENPYKDAKVTVTDDTKTIAGYRCRKAIIEPKDSKDGKLELYFTKDLGSNARNASGPFKQIEGAVLEYSIKQQGMDMKFTASTVSKENVPDSKFKIPDGYTFMSRKDFMKSMGGGK